MTSRAAIIALALAAQLTAGCGPRVAAAENPVEPPASPAPISSPTAQKPHQSLDELKSQIEKIVAKYHIPGVGIALVKRDGVIWAGGVGKADLGSGKAVTADTMFRIGSITKGFVALSLLKLQEQGKVSLDAKLSDLAPEVPIVNPWEATDPVRVANILEHTAGFDDFPFAEFYDLSGGPEMPLLKVLQTFPGPQYVRWRPGTLAAYSNPDYGVAGYLVEKVSGRPCEDYIAENILRPLGMAHSDMRLTPAVRATLAQGYVSNPPRPIPYHPIYLRPAGEMKSSPAEMAHFVRMMLNRGELDGVRIVSADSIARMEVGKTGLAAKGGLANTYGLGNVPDISGPFLAHGHDGGIDGFISRYEYMVEPGNGYFFSINDTSRQSGMAFKEISDALSAFLTQGLTPPPKPARAQLDARLAQITGFYQFASHRKAAYGFLESLLVCGWTYIDHGKLYRRGLIPGAREETIYLGTGQIRTEKEVAASGVFVIDQDGNRYGCGALSCFERTDPTWPVIRLLLIAAALVLMVSSMLFALVWVPRKLLGRMKGVGHLELRLIPLLAVFTWIPMVIASWNVSVLQLSGPTINSITLTIGTIVFAVLSLLSMIFAMRSFRYEMNRAAKIHSILVACSCFGITWYLGYWGLIGARIWTL